MTTQFSVGDTVVHRDLDFGYGTVLFVEDDDYGTLVTVKFDSKDIPCYSQYLTLVISATTNQENYPMTVPTTPNDGGSRTLALLNLIKQYAPSIDIDTAFGFVTAIIGLDGLIPYEEEPLPVVTSPDGKATYSWEKGRWDFPHNVLVREVEHLLRSWKISDPFSKIYVIKALRNDLKCSLKEAKDAVEDSSLTELFNEVDASIKAYKNAVFPSTTNSPTGRNEPICGNPHCRTCYPA